MRWSNRMTPSFISRSFPSSVHWYLLSLLSVGSWLNLTWAIPRFLSRANKWLKSAMLTPSYIMCSFSLYSRHFLFPNRNTENAKLTHSWKLVSVLSPVVKERMNSGGKAHTSVVPGPGWRGRTTAQRHFPQASSQSRMDKTHPINHGEWPPA